MSLSRGSSSTLNQQVRKTTTNAALHHCISRTLRYSLEHFEQSQHSEGPECSESIEAIDVRQDNLKVCESDDDDVKHVESILHVIPEAKRKLWVGNDGTV